MRNSEHHTAAEPLRERSYGTKFSGLQQNHLRKDGPFERKRFIATQLKSTGVVDDIPKLIRDKLSKITDIYPNTRYSCVLSDMGDLIVMNPAEEVISATLLSTVSSMRRSVSQFGQSLGANECPVIHITGKSYMFSSYDIGSFLLAFYTEIDSENFNTFDVSETDKKMLELVSDLRLMLKNAIIVRADSAI